jgi:hypothetical protein
MCQDLGETMLESSQKNVEERKLCAVTCQVGRGMRPLSTKPQFINQYNADNLDPGSFVQL